MAQRPMGDSPMEYMVGFFEGIFDVMGAIAAKAISRAYEETQKRHRDFFEDVRGEQIPHCIADEMAFENTDLTRKMAFNWSTKDLNAYMQQWNALPEAEKQRRRDIFEKKQTPKIQKQIQIYEADTGEIFDNPGAYCRYDRARQPIYLQRLAKENQNTGSSAQVNMNQTPEPKKEQDLHQQLNKQSSNQRQKDEIKNNELDGKKSVEKEIKDKTDVKAGEKISNATNEVKDGKYTNLEVEKHHKNIQYKSEYSSASNKVENNKYTSLAIENRNHEEFRAKVKEGAEKRKQQSKLNFEIQKVNQNQDKKNNVL